MGKTLRAVLGAFIIGVAVTSISRGALKWDFKSTAQGDFKSKRIEKKVAEEVDRRVKSVARENIEAVVRGFLKDMGIKSEKIEIFMDTNADDRISIIKCEICVRKEYGDSRGRIEKEIREKLGIEAKVIASDH